MQPLAKRAYFQLRKLVLSAGALLLPKRRMPEPGSIKSILVVRTDCLGDAVLSLPFFESVRRAHDRAHMTILCRADLADLVGGASGADAVIGYTGLSTGLLARLRAAHYDLAIDAVLDSDLLTAVICRASGARFCVGFESRDRGVILDQAVAVAGQRHFTEELAELAAALGLPEERSEPKLRLSRSQLDQARASLAARGIAPADKLLFIHPGGHYRAQRWPAGRFAHAAASARRSFGCKVIAAAGPAEASELETIRDIARPDAVFLGPTTLDLASLIALSGVFAGNNSGPLHLAGALGVPTVSTMGPSDPVRWRPLGRHVAVLKACDFGAGDDVSLIPEAAFAAALNDMSAYAKPLGERYELCLRASG